MSKARVVITGAAGFIGSHLAETLLDRGYKDAAAQVGAGLIPTWPANKRIPPIITIDHVLVDHRVGVKAVSVHDVPGTDHRAVFAELTVP